MQNRPYVDYRKPANRKAGFQKFYEFHYTTNDCSPDIAVESWLADELDFDFEQRCVLALFQGAVYSGPVETIFAIEFPKVTGAMNEITKFFMKNKERLKFSDDCKYRKMVFEKFLASVGKSVERYGSLGQLVAFCFDSDDRKQNYIKLQNLCMEEWYHWGRMGHWCFSEALYSFVKAPITPPTMEFADGKSHRAGWAFCLNRDDLTGDKISKADCDYLEREASKFIATLEHPNANFFTLETACCNYKRQHKGSRYGGCYIDEQYDDIQWARENWPEHNSLWDTYMRGRQAVLPASLLYENNSSQSPPLSKMAYQKSWTKSLRDYGRIPRVDAWFNGEPQVWTDLKNLPFVHD
jgi:hypothetical protein